MKEKEIRRQKETDIKRLAEETHKTEERKKKDELQRKQDEENMSKQTELMRLQEEGKSQGEEISTASDRADRLPFFPAEKRGWEKRRNRNLGYHTS